MSYFSTTLRRVLECTFGGKQTALASASGIEQSEISRLLREASPCTAAKLAKLCETPEMPDRDKHDLCIAAVHDLVPEPQWSELFGPDSHPESRLRESSPYVYQGTSPLPPGADRVLRYLVDNAGHSQQISDALELFGRFLPIPSPKEPEQ